MGSFRNRFYGTMDIYDNLGLDGIGPDLTGWLGSPVSTFYSILDKLQKIQTIIEVGSWKGLSAITMARYLIGKSINAEIICVDTFLGSSEHYLDPSLRCFETKNLRPTLYEQFLYNIIDRGMTEIITPLPQTSSIASTILKHHGILADLIYIDASHHYKDVYDDMINYWDLLKAGGIIALDDYNVFDGVNEAVRMFESTYCVSGHVDGYKWYLIK